MHTFYCYNHMIRDCFLLSFLTSGTIFWSVIIDSVLTGLPVVLFQRTYDPSEMGSKTKAGSGREFRNRKSGFLYNVRITCSF